MDKVQKSITDILIVTDGFPVLKFFTISFFIEPFVEARLSVDVGQDPRFSGKGMLDQLHAVWEEIKKGNISSEEDLEQRAVMLFEFMKAEKQVADGDVLPHQLDDDQESTQLTFLDTAKQFLTN